MATSQEAVIELRKLAVQAETRYGKDTPVITAAMLHAVLDGKPGTLKVLRSRAGV